jgi:hypothetical protein
MFMVCAFGGSRFDGAPLSDKYGKVREAIERRRKVKGKIYRTYVDVDGKGYVLTTTHKDTALELSTYEKSELQDLVAFFDAELTLAKNPEMLFKVHHDDEGGVLVTIAHATDAGKIFHLAPVH